MIFIDLDKRKNNGAKKGVHQGQGRKPKATELELIERLSPFDDIALKALEAGVKSGEYNFIKLFMEYRFGKAKETVAMTNEITILEGYEDNSFTSPARQPKEDH